jgi:predicted ATP-binding protein involved in virulence
LAGNRFKQEANLNLADISYGASSCRIGAEFCFGDTIESYSRSMIRKEKRRLHRQQELNALVVSWKEHYQKNEVFVKGMPVFANYGVNRLVLDIPLRIRTKHEFDPLSAFEKAIENRIDFRLFFEWFRYREDIENEQKVRNSRSFSDSALSAVKQAIYTMFESESDKYASLRIQRNPLSMKMDKNGISLSVEQLSDGEKCLIAMVGDLARRLTIANPEAKKPLLGTGVVLIDEIELHLHPVWQRLVLPRLVKIFPNIQFIVTTHSPQVLGELDNTYNIFSIEKTKETISIESIASLIGWNSNYILEDFMGAKSISKKTRQLIGEIYEAIDKNDVQKAFSAICSLEACTDAAHEDVVRAKLLLGRLKRQ